MINGVSNSGHLPPSLVTGTRSTISGAGSHRSSSVAASEEQASATEGGADVYRQYQTLDLAVRQFSQLLPRIEGLDVQIE